MIHHQLGAAIASASTPAQLDQLAGTLWRAYAAGQIAENQAQSLGEAVESRRRAFRRPEKGPAVLRVAVSVSRKETRTAASEAPRPAPGLRRNGPRQLVLRIPRPATYDRTCSLERRRHLAASGPMPPQLAASFTTGELAVLRIIADEVRNHGQCDRTLGEIAARAGVCRATAQNALRHAARLGLLTIEERRRSGRSNLPNVVRITSREWLAWLARGPKGGGSKISAPTDKSGFSRKKGSEERAPRRSMLTENRRPVRTSPQYLRG